MTLTCLFRLSLKTPHYGPPGLAPPLLDVPHSEGNEKYYHYRGEWKDGHMCGYGTSLLLLKQQSKTHSTYSVFLWCRTSSSVCIERFQYQLQYFEVLLRRKQARAHVRPRYAQQQLWITCSHAHTPPLGTRASACEFVYCAHAGMLALCAVRSNAFQTSGFSCYSHVALTYMYILVSTVCICTPVCCQHSTALQEADLVPRRCLRRVAWQGCTAGPTARHTRCHHAQQRYCHIHYCSQRTRKHVAPAAGVCYLLLQCRIESHVGTRKWCMILVPCRP
jgi:hypothetical protein